MGSDANVGGSSMSSTVTNIVLWMFVPSAIANFLLNQYYSFKYSKNSPSIPKANSAKHKSNYKICYTFVIGLYFLYSIMQSLYSLEESYYSKIGLKRGCTRTEFKRKSRQLMLIHHPDKSSGNANLFHDLKKMAEVLENPNLCNIYEKFGESGVNTVLQFTSKKNFVNDQEVRKDYIHATLFDWVTFYIGSAAVLLLTSFAHKSGSGRYWRLISLICIGSFESYLYFNDFTTLDSIHTNSKFKISMPSTWISLLLLSVPIFQRIQIMRQLFVYSGLALSQLGPLWFPTDSDLFSNKKTLIMEIENIQKNSLSELYEESNYVFSSAFEPFENNEEMKALLKRQMGQIVVDLKILETMATKASSESKKTR